MSIDEHDTTADLGEVSKWVKIHSESPDIGFSITDDAISLEVRGVRGGGREV